MRMMETYWDLVVKYCQDFVKSGSNTYIEAFDGQFLHKISRDIKRKTIKQYLNNQEMNYVE